MKPSPCIARVLLLIAVLLIPCSLTADIIILKSGDLKTGTIVAEDDVSVTLEYLLTAKIKDKVKILKTNIKEIIRQAPAKEKLLPSRGLMGTSDGGGILEDRLRTD